MANFRTTPPGEAAEHDPDVALQEASDDARLIAELMSAPVPPPPAIIVVGDDAVAGITPPPRG